MIGQQNRFHGYGSLRHVYKSGQTIRGPLNSLKYLPTQRGTYRLAVVVSRRVDKSAVSRNRMRRRLYEVVRQLQDQTKSYDMVITVFHESIKDLSYEKLVRLIRAQLYQAGIINSKKPE